MTKSKLMVVALIAVSILFFPRPLLSEDAFNIQHTAEFSKGNLSFDKLMGYDVVRLKNGYYPDQLGKPMLPLTELQIALPAGMMAKSVRVVDTKSEEIPGGYNIFPVQPPRRIGDSDRDVDFVEPDEEIYSSSQPYPSKLVEFVHQGDLAGQSIAIIQLYPLQYVPKERRLTFYTSVSFVVEGVDGYECGHYLSPNISERGRRTYEQMVKDMVVNPDDVQLTTASKMRSSTELSGGPFDHVIITSSSFASYFQPLVDWHTQKGVKDTVVTTEWIYSNPAYFGDDQSKIQMFIQDANEYSDWGTTYFLLGGEHETVPFKYMTYYEENTPSDQYYSDFDDDWFHEVFVGRVSVGNTTEINTFINKVLKYEKDPPRTDYPLDVLLIGMDLDTYTLGEDLKEYINSYIPERFNVTKVYDSDPGYHRTPIINALNAGQNLVNHADHSDWNCLGAGNYHWPHYCIYNNNVDLLTNNDQTSIIVSVGCNPNKMDYSSDCIAEHFVIYNPDQAGVAFTGNTRDGIYTEGYPISRSGKLDKEWWVSLFSRNKYNLGQTLIDAKNNYINTLDIQKHCEWTFNLLGEPEMPIWTDEPDSFALTCTSIVSTVRTLPFPVHVEDSTTHDPVDDAYVCLWKEGEVYLTGYTDVGGDITFNPSPFTLGIMYVTVTKHNYIPYQQEVEVEELCGDVNGDKVVEIGDVVYLINYLYKSGLAPDPLELGDVNLDVVVDIGDVVYLINYLYKKGTPPCQPGS